ncbi:unnamed protein product, partial [Polarella glacialis]
VTYPGIFWKAALSMTVALLVNGLLLLAIVEPEPWYNAQYLIPMAGMLINSSLTGVALALNSMIDHLHTGREQVEVLLAFGATPWEAAWPGFVKAVQAALIPAINGMNVVGLVSIPGMMTGQILGGAPPMKAARYQIVITFLISGCTFLSVCIICAFTIQAFFDAKGRHDGSVIREQSRINVSKICDPSLWRRKLWRSPKSLAEPLTAESGAAGQEGLGSTTMELRCSTQSQSSAVVGSQSAAVEVLDLDAEGAVGESRRLHASLVLRQGEVVCIMGPSGAGKSTLLKWICDLEASGGRTAMRLQGASSESLSPQVWRRSVLYVQQTKAPLQGTPRMFIQAVERLKVNRGRDRLQLAPLMQAVGLDELLLDRPWGELSGGEAQRIMCAIALACRPACILLDEPTSALDDASKLLVEQLLSSGGHASCVITAVFQDGQPAKSCQIILPQKQLKRKNDIYVMMVSWAHCIAAKDKYVAIVSTVVETQNPEKEIEPAIKLLGPILEKFVNISEILESCSDGTKDGVFVTSTVDESSHLEEGAKEVLAMWKTITGEDLDLTVLPEEEEQ